MPQKPTPYVVLNGKLLLAEEAGFPVHHQSLVDSFGIYESVKVKEGRFFHMGRHLQRLQRSADILELELPAPLDEIWQWARDLVATVRDGNGMLRIVAYGDDGVHEAVCGLYVKPWPTFARPLYEHGAAVITFEGERTRPLAKSTNCLAQALARRQAHKVGAHEGLLVDRHGHVTEGTTSNLLVVKDGEILRPLPGTALEGVTEGITLQLAAEMGIPVRQAALPLADVRTWDEAFITSTHRPIIPIGRVDDVSLPPAPGPITQRLMAAYAEYDASQGWEE